MDREHQGARYTTAMVSDIVRDGMGLELYKTTVQGKACTVAEVFYSDAEHTWALNTFDGEVSLDIIEELIAEAQARRPG